ncbi:catalase [Nostoc sp. ChiQUE01b]|uniref:catalase n=1 Tax=Nostoc sp. ChiQUE01b TaxID=3075376 RepID=UPI002AD4ADAF|nr:catalase [Nostoc sp. ChiQUE01b]MDZ8237184.1 catalase [Nostoc sp. ChiQUE01a]MDZ8262873.1 catalase [Nostoc sp. ChiQUE01b]
MKLFTEYPEKDEAKYCTLMSELVKKNMDNLYGGDKKKTAKRDTHSKTHAAVQGTLEIFDFDEAAIKQELSKRTSLTEAQLQAISLKQGLFAKPKQYPVWLRFASGAFSVKNDYEGDTRSMAVKVIGVEGERLPQSHELKTQDIIVHNTELFFIRTIKDFYGFFLQVYRAKLSPFLIPFFLLWRALHPYEYTLLETSFKRFPKTLLIERYWSASAYSVGLKSDFDPYKPGQVPVEYPAVIKYGFIPVSSQPPHQQLPLESRPESELQRVKASGSEDNYYREDIIQALAKPDAEYTWDFQIQFQTKPEMSIDDTTIPWNEEESPFFTVGRLTVKHQKVDSPLENDFGENLSFAPGNGLAVHRPVGAINRLRSIIYPIVANDRHEKRGVKYQEPTVGAKF